MAGENLLGQLAQQFGRASGRGRALRDALGGINPSTGKWEPHKPDVRVLDHTPEPHARGAILVEAVFGAFLKVYRARTADLYRIASEGTGVLREEDIHPDLSHRLAAEAARSAQQALQMCIRAIDYCPPVGITFGDYLRAVVTADTDFNPEDAGGYRLAFVESFRQWGIHPEGRRSMSVEGLLWPTGDEAEEEAAVRLDREELRSLFTEVQSTGDPEQSGTRRLSRPVADRLRPWSLESDDIAVITHEHQDHVNGITATHFADLKIGETWLAWTEDPNNGVANELRKTFSDKLLGLLAARNRLAAAGDTWQAARIDEFLAFELGGDSEEFDAPAAVALLGAAGGSPAALMNKQSMKIVKDRAKNGVRYIRPHEEILAIPGAKEVRVFALGPPRDKDQLEDLNPQGDEQFHGIALATASAGNYFAAAAAAPAAHGQSPFASRYALDQNIAFGDSVFGAVSSRPTKTSIR